MEPKVGSFCWLELATSNQAAAKQFYTNLFGWTAEDNPMGPSMTYTMMRLGGKDVSGAYGLMKEQIDAHVPPYWILYIKMDSVDATAEKASKLGGKTLVPPSDIPNVGRFSVIQDPTGAAIGLFQPGQHRGFTVFGDVGALCWSDLSTTDPGKAAQFYGDLLGWKFETGKDGYRHIVNGSSQEDMVGGVQPHMHGPPGTPSHWMPYFRVADCNASAAKAVALGGRAVMPATPMENVGTIAVILDPQGAAFSLFQSARQ